MSEPATIDKPGPDQLTDAEGAIPTFARRTVDPALGAVPPLSDEERAARAAVLARTLNAIARITDETDDDERITEFMRDIDAARVHGRKLFEGMY